MLHFDRIWPALLLTMISVWCTPIPQKFLLMLWSLYDIFHLNYSICHSMVGFRFNRIDLVLYWKFTIFATSVSHNWISFCRKNVGGFCLPCLLHLKCTPTTHAHKHNQTITKTFHLLVSMHRLNAVITIDTVFSHLLSDFAIQFNSKREFSNHLYPFRFCDFTPNKCQKQKRKRERKKLETFRNR